MHLLNYHPAPTLFLLQPLTVEATVPLFVHRFANGVPMLDTNTSSACALVAGVAKAGWRGLGLKLSASRVLPSEGKLRFSISEAPTTLKVTGEGCEGDRCMYRRPKRAPCRARVLSSFVAQ